MTNINLLPWRESKREKEKNQFQLYIGIGLAIAIGAVFLINYNVKDLIQNQSYSNQLLQTEIDELKRQIVEIANLKKLRTALIARMNIVQNLQSTRILTVRLLDELVRIIPDGVFLTNVERVENKITLLGYAESNSQISQLMRNIESNVWIENPDLTEIKKTVESEEYTRENQFKLSFALRGGDVEMDIPDTQEISPSVRGRKGLVRAKSSPKGTKQ
jgi:type IV pilus assembly protein PilN